jgi:hypothetical protein
MESYLKVTRQLFSVVTLCIASSFAENFVFAAVPIDTDGPDFVESSEVIGKNRFQYEADFLSQRDTRASTTVNTTSTPTLIKYGISETTEVRIETEGYIWSDNSSTNAILSGAGDTALGLKWHTLDGGKTTGKPSISWILHFDVPTGTNGFSKPGIRPSVRTVMTWELPENFALGIMPGIKYDSAEDGHRFTSGIFGAVLNNHVTESFRAFVELAVQQLAQSQDGGTIAYWDIGAAYLLTVDTQLGFRGGVAANQNTPSNYLLFELAQRF